MNTTELQARLRAQAREEGFVKLGICRPDAIPEARARLARFVELGRHGQMGWMAERRHWRGDPTTLWPQARSVVMLAESYSPPEDPLPELNHPERGYISVYARGRDYHDVVKKRLKRLGRWLIDTAGSGTEIKVFVDTAPVMEKPLAAAAGLGWQGKHTNLVARDLGNWLFLGAIFTTLELPHDPPEPDHCGSCRACLDICPTKAFPAPYQLDARRCISYLTIEHDGPIAPDLRPLLGNRIYGCDDCLAICPWNKFAQPMVDLNYRSRPDPVDLDVLVNLSEAEFRTRFSKSPIKRIGHLRFKRNVLYAIGNSSEISLISAAEPWRTHPDDTIRDAANWAILRLSQEDLS